MRKIPASLPTKFSNLSGFIKQDGNSDITINAEIELESNGYAVIKGTYKPVKNLLDSYSPFDLILKSHDGWELHCEKWVVDNDNVTITIGSNIPEAHSFVGSSLRIRAINGDQKSELDGGETYAVLIGGDEVFSGDLRDQNRERTIIDLSPTGRKSFLYGTRLLQLNQEVGYLALKDESHSLSDDIDYIHQICHFLSFAYSRFITCPWMIRFTEKCTIVEINRIKYSGNASPVLNLKYPRQISNLIINGWREWNKLCISLDLPRLFHQFILANDQPFVESSLMLSSIWLEMLKHNFAKNVKSYPQAKGGFFLKADGKSKYTFKELLNSAFQHFNVVPPNESFIKDIRNPVIHTGSILVPWEQMLKEKLDVLDRIVDYFLTLFCFTELVWDRKQDNWIEKK
jgi:hypothetical protein